MLRLDLPTLAGASQANAGGPASAVALTTAKGYASRLLPGVAEGSSGMRLATASGLALLT